MDRFLALVALFAAVAVSSVSANHIIDHGTLVPDSSDPPRFGSLTCVDTVAGLAGTMEELLRMDRCTGDFRPAFEFISSVLHAQTTEVQELKDSGNTETVELLNKALPTDKASEIMHASTQGVSISYRIAKASDDPSELAKAAECLAVADEVSAYLEQVDAACRTQLPESAHLLIRPLADMIVAAASGESKPAALTSALTETIEGIEAMSHKDDLELSPTPHTGTPETDPGTSSGTSPGMVDTSPDNGGGDDKLVSNQIDSGAQGGSCRPEAPLCNAGLHCVNGKCSTSISSSGPGSTSILLELMAGNPPTNQEIAALQAAGVCPNTPAGQAQTAIRLMYTNINGCSAPGGWAPYIGTFTSSCDRHDVCYTCGSRPFPHNGAQVTLSRRTCDDVFFADMVNACRRRYCARFLNAIQRSYCYDAATKYYTAVRVAGGSHYTAAPPHHASCPHVCAQNFMMNRLTSTNFPC